jgi:hypothetical protein
MKNAFKISRRGSGATQDGHLSMRCVGLTAFALLGCMPMTARADGFRIAELCNRSHRDLIASYVEGALDNAESATMAIMANLQGALEAGSTESDGLKRSWKLVMSYCPPSRYAANEAADILCNYLAVNPHKRKGESIALLNEALQSAWPCPANRAK